MSTRATLRILSMTALTATLAAPAALAQQSGYPFASAAYSSAQTSPLDFLERFEGEWEGTVQMRRDGVVSASVCSASFERDYDGARVSGVFEGFAFGEHFDGAATWIVTSDDQVRCSWFDNAQQRQRKDSLVLVEDNVETVLTSAQPYTNPVVRHAASIDDEGRLIIQWIEVMDDGTARPAFKMTLERLSDGQQAAAHDLFETSDSLQRVRSSATASVPE